VSTAAGGDKDEGQLEDLEDSVELSSGSEWSVGSADGSSRRPKRRAGRRRHAAKKPGAAAAGPRRLKRLAKRAPDAAAATSGARSSSKSTDATRQLRAELAVMHVRSRLQRELALQVRVLSLPKWHSFLHSQISDGDLLLFDKHLLAACSQGSTSNWSTIVNMLLHEIDLLGSWSYLSGKYSMKDR
jgi:hypothetical protein